MRMLYKRSGIKYEDVKFVEAHGTGTQVSVFAFNFGLYILLCLKFAMDCEYGLWTFLLIPYKVLDP